jgi:hypothetical protein
MTAIEPRSCEKYLIPAQNEGHRIFGIEGVFLVFVPAFDQGGLQRVMVIPIGGCHLFFAVDHDGDGRVAILAGCQAILEFLIPFDRTGALVFSNDRGYTLLVIFALLGGFHRRNQLDLSFLGQDARDRDRIC